MKQVFHYATFMLEQAQKYQEKIALRYRTTTDKTWREMTWNKFANKISLISNAFVELGLKEEQKVGQFSQNMPENLIVDYALYANRAVMVPIYATSSELQVEYIVNDASIEIIFVGEQQQYDVAVAVLKKSTVLKYIVALDNNVVFSEKEHSMYFSDLLNIGKESKQQAVVKERQSQATEDDLAAIFYTSGTTGNPKGVMLTHGGFNAAMRIHDSRLTSITDDDDSIAFLPLTHIFERLWSYYCLYKGVLITINLRPTEIQQTIKEIRPTLMCAVPRFWEKVYIGVKENLSNYSEFMLGVITWAIAVGKKYNVDYLRIGKKPNWWLSMRYKIADKLIFSKVKNTLGIENANLLPTAAAPLSDHINLFFQSIGVPICYGYGLTESFATVSCFDYVGYEIGSVGTLMPGVEVKIGEDSEILLRGKTIFKGYYNQPEVNKESFTEDGFFRTGDAGFLKDGHLYLTERIKDLFKTSNGKYIAPQQIEGMLTSDKFIEQAVVIGDQRNYVTAIIVPDLTQLQNYAIANNIKFETIDDLISNKDIYAFFEQRIKEAQSGMANFEQVKKFTIIKKVFTIETGELTNTLKIRRAIVMQKYASLIDAMYEQTDKHELIR